jgi:tetratricopeptide (TPR) repeat protein
LVNYYSSFGKDTAALYVPDGNMHLYGGFFEVITGYTNKMLGFDEMNFAYHQVRHVFSAFFGWVAILCIALLARYIAGGPAGVFTLLLLFFSSRFIGDSFVNPKDIPFAAGYAMALYFMARVLDGLPKPNKWHLAGLAGGLAIALAMRAGGLLPFAYLGMFAGLHLVLKSGFGSVFNVKSLKPYVIYAGLAGVAGYFLAVLFWPYALQSPFKNPFVALAKFSELEVKIRVLYEGVNVMSDKTPWHYPIKWIFYTIPLAAIVGFAGYVVLFKSMTKKYQPLWVFMLLFAAVFPVAYIIYKDSVIHDGWRHLTFVYPPLAAAAGVFWGTMWNRFAEKKTIQYVVAGAFALLLVDSAFFMVRNAPNAYVYFNPLIGGVKGAYGQFETDYWGISTKQAVEWMEKEGILSDDMEQPIVIASNMWFSVKRMTAKYGDKVIIKYLKWEKRCDDAWDYAIYPTRFIDGATLQKGNWPPANAVHVVEVGGAPLMAVIKDNGKNCSLGIASMKLGDWEGAINFLSQEVKAVPNNDLAWTNLAQCYINSNQLEEGKAAAEKALDISPDDVQSNNLLGMYWLRKNDVAKAKAQFQDAIRREPSNPAAYYYLALIAQNGGDMQTALTELSKAIQISPTFKPAYELAIRIYEAQGNAAAAQQYRSVLSQLK